VNIALIANPGAGGSTDTDEVAVALRAHGAEIEHFSLDEADLERAARSGAERVVVAGGDGSIGPAAGVAQALGVPLGLVPTGTANDFARSQAIPLEIPRACAVAMEGTHRQRMDLGRLSSGCLFVNVANTGLSTSAAREAAPLKSVLGPVAYGVGAVRAASSAKPLSCRVSVDGREIFSARSWQVIVGVTGAFGGGSELGSADPQDGQLDVAVLPAGSRLGLVRRAWGMRTGTICAQPDVIHERGREIVLELPPGTELNVDGEVIDAARPERATIEPGAFLLIVPD
jgi:YegS/Rv2252/BmrU family lipid kinase